MKFKEFLKISNIWWGVFQSIFIILVYVFIKGWTSLSMIITLQAFFLGIPISFVVSSINDIFDYGYDKLNEKKAESVELFSRTDIRRDSVLLSIIFLLAIIIISLFTRNIQNMLLVLFVIFLGLFYSIPPLRFKSIPFLDFLIVPAGHLSLFLIAYSYVGNIWTAPFLAYSILAIASIIALQLQILDYDSDKKARQITTVTFLGKTNTKILISLLLIANFLIFYRINIFVFIYLIGFLMLNLICFVKEKKIMSLIQFGHFIILIILLLFYWFYPIS